MRALFLIGALACLLCAPPLRAESTLGSLEAEALQSALALRGLAVDPAPQGKSVGQIHVVNLEVFQPADGRLLSFLNHFHITTREHHVRRESLLVPGMPYDQALVDETVRNLRAYATSSDDPMLSGLVVAVPVAAPAPGTVDLLIVTRDLWSLRFNTDYEYQKASLLRLSTSLSENNFLGRRKHISVVFDMQQGYANIGPTYYDPNLLGTRMRLTSAIYGTWARRIDEIALGGREGSVGRFKLEYPFFSLATKHSATTDLYYRKGVDRLFREAALGVFRPGSDVACTGPVATDDASALPCAFKILYVSESTGYVRSFRPAYGVHRIGVGHELQYRRADFMPGFSTDESIRDLFATRVMGANYRNSGLSLTYGYFTPNYRVMRNYETYDLGEDVRLGPLFYVKVVRSARILGADSDSTFVYMDAHLNAGFGGGFQNIGASVEGRFYDPTLRDILIKAYGRASTGMVGRAFRVVVAGAAGVLRDNRMHGRFIVGGTEGLRGYPVGAFYGSAAKGADSAYYLGHVEFRSVPLSLWALRWGGLVFADAGHVATTVGGLSFYPDVGIGLRVLIPQLNAEVLRFDWAIPLRAYAYGGVPPTIIPAGFGGQRLSFGFKQAF